MIRSSTFSIRFNYQGKTVSYQVDKMYVEYYEVKEFYRICARTGNRDVMKKDGKWIIVNNAPLPEHILNLVGGAIERAESEGLPNFIELRGYH